MINIVYFLHNHIQHLLSVTFIHVIKGNIKVLQFHGFVHTSREYACNDYISRFHKTERCARFAENVLFAANTGLQKKLLTKFALNEQIYCEQ
jgi:hypothetical protein